MSDRRKRIIVRATAIGLQWAALTVLLGSIIMRSDASYNQLISPHLGGVYVFVGGVLAGFLLGLTVESPRFLAPMVILMCIGAAAFVGVLAYAPVWDGLIVRTTRLDNVVTQRALLMLFVVFMAAIPGAVAGNLLGSNLRVNQEIAPHPEELEDSGETPWWEQRSGPDRSQRSV
jgi:hypothetical protein